LKRFTLVVVAVCAVGLLTACYKNPTISLPPPAPSRLFVSSFGSGKVNFVSQPFAPTSTVTTVATLASPLGIAVDRTGNLYVAVHTGFVMLAAPVTTTTAPVATAIAGASEPYGALIAQNGNLFITDAGANNLSVFSSPATAPALVQTTTVASFNRPEGMSQDLAGRTFVAQEGNGTIVVLPAGFGAAPVPVGVLTLPAGSHPVGLANDTHDNLYVADFSSGNVQVYTPPWATSSRTPIFSIPLPVGLGGADFLTFDTSGNLYVAYETCAALCVAIFSPPFSGASSPSFQLPIANADGVAFAL